MFRSGEEGLDGGWRGEACPSWKLSQTKHAVCVVWRDSRQIRSLKVNGFSLSMPGRWKLHGWEVAGWMALRAARLLMT